MNISNVIGFFFLLLSFSGTAQVLSLNKLSPCLINNCDQYNLYKEHNFKKVYAGPRKEGGFLSLFHNTLKNEYIFSYSNEDSQIEQFTYYLPDKIAYDNFLKTKNELTQITGEGRILYEGKKYYQIIIRKK